MPRLMLGLTLRRRLRLRPAQPCRLRCMAVCLWLEALIRHLDGSLGTAACVGWQAPLPNTCRGVGAIGICNHMLRSCRHMALSACFGMPCRGGVEGLKWVRRRRPRMGRALCLETTNRMSRPEQHAGWRVKHGALIRYC